MARTRIIFDKDGMKAEYLNGELIWSRDPVDEKKEAGYYIQGDLKPYQSMVDGSMIEGRAQHKEHLRTHNLIEVGNETKHLKGFGNYKPQGIKQSLIDAVHQVRERERK